MGFLMALREGDPGFLHAARLADDLNVHWRAADLAVFDGRVIALRCVGHRSNDFSAMRALDLNFDEHD